MVRELPRQLIKWKKSSWDLVEEIRGLGINLCKKYQKKLLLPDKEDIKWLKEDLDLDSFEGNRKSLIEEVEKRPSILIYYQPDQVVWAKRWIYVISEIAFDGHFNTGNMDFCLFYSNLYPFPPLTNLTLNYTIWGLYYRLVNKTKEAQLNQILTIDQETFAKLLKGDTIPQQYLTYTSYNTLRKRVQEEYIRRNPGFLKHLPK